MSRPFGAFQRSPDPARSHQKTTVTCLDKERRRGRDFYPAVWAEISKGGDATRYKLVTVIFWLTPIHGRWFSMAARNYGKNKAEAVVPPRAESPLDDTGREELWTKTRAGDRDAYEALVDSYLPLVKITVSRMAINLPSFISREDLYSAGYLGLVSAVDRYDSSRDAKFSTYAITRIRGAVLDELRSHDVLGRVVRDRVSRIERAESELLSRNAFASPEEIAEGAGLSMDEYWDAEMGAQAARRISLSDTGAGGSRRSLEDILLSNRDDSPGARLEAEEILEKVMGMLTDKEKQLVVMYYEEELTLKEIGELLNVTESRVCQIHGAMIQKIRKRLAAMGVPL